MRTGARAFLLTLAVLLLAADWTAPALYSLAGLPVSSYETQFRDHPDSPPSARFPLGTDELGRDRLLRLLHGSRVSLLLAPAAALLATVIASVIGLAAGYCGGWVERAAMFVADLFVALPWIFALLLVRALLPLNVSPWTSVAVTFLLLGLMGWASGARVIRAGASAARSAAFVLQAQAAGCGRVRILFRHVLPHLRPAMLAQFWISIPLFLLSEANLGLLGLGVTEPLPSWGSLMGELARGGAIREQPWLLAPVLLFLTVLGAFQLALPRREAHAQ